MAVSTVRFRIAAENRKARHNYFIEDTVEAGIALVGTEVKSLRTGKANIGDAYATEDRGEFFLLNCYIAEYEQGNRFNHDPRRPRKLLLHRHQIDKLAGAIKRQGMTVVPLKLYFNERGRAKLELGLARGKQAHDKRDAERDRDWQREKGRLLRNKV